MNELLFIGHALLIAIVSLGALRLGKEALIAWMAILAILSNLFVLKEMSVFGISVTCTDAFAVGCIFTLNLIVEYFGRRAGGKAIITSFGLMIVTILLSGLHLLYTPAGTDTAQAAYSLVLTHMPRIMLASLTAYLLVQLVDIRIYSRLKKRLAGRHVLLRSGFSLISSQLLDTVLFSFLGLWGIVSSIGSVILFSFCVKMVVALLCVPFVLLAKWMMHPAKIEGSIMYNQQLRLSAARQAHEAPVHNIDPPEQNQQTL